MNAVQSTDHRSVHAFGGNGPLWANRGFVCLLAAYAISAFGDHLNELGLWQLMDAPNSDRQVQLQAAMRFAFFLPFLIFGLLAGVLADRASRKWIMITADLFRAGIVVAIAWWFTFATEGAMGLTPVQAALIAPLLVGVFAAFFSPARIALLPKLVADKQLTRANSLCNGLGIIASMGSYAVGGYLAAWSVHWSFRIDAMTFVCSALLLWWIRVPRWGPADPHREGWLTSVAEAVRYVRDHGRVRQLILVTVLFWTAAATFECTIPPIVSHRYHMGIEQLGLFRGAMGLGMIVGAVLLSYLAEALRADTVITWSLLGAGACLTGFGLAASPLWGAIFTIGAGVFGVALLIVVTTLLQRLVPDYARGRVFGISDLVSMAGLLAATGLLGFAPLKQIDRSVVHILLIVSGGLGLAGAASMIGSVQRSRLGVVRCFWRRLNEFYCKWYFRLKREGICTIPHTGPVIVVANHTSSIDPLLLLAASPHRHMGFMVGKEYYDLPAVGRLLRMIECVPVTRSGIDTVATRRALRQLQAGKVLGIFPEGGIPQPDEVREPRGGVALLAIHTGAVVVPAHISGTRYSQSVVWPFLRRCRARVRFGRPIHLSEYDGQTHRRARQEVATLIMRRIRSLGDDAQ